MYNDSELRAVIARAGSNMKDAAKRIGISENAMTQKRKRGHFTIENVSRLADAYYLTAQDIQRIFFAQFTN